MASKLVFKKVGGVFLTAISIIAVALYFSRMCEGFETTKSSIPNSATIDALLESVNTPDWFTPVRHTTLINSKVLYNSKKIDPVVKISYDTLLSNIFSESKAAGEKDDVTFDKLMVAKTKYLNSFDVSLSSTNTTIYNVPLYIQLLVGASLIMGIIAFYRY